MGELHKTRTHILSTPHFNSSHSHHHAVYEYIYIYIERERERHTHSTRIKKKEAKVYTVVFISLYLQYINEKYISTLT
jgi:hypothetical protein